MRRSYYNYLLIFLITWIVALSTHAQKRVGYMQSWKSQITADQASKLTHVIYSFATIHPDLDGKLNAIDGNYLSTMVTIAHAQGAKAILAVGGWFPCSYAYQSGACAADGNPEAFNAVSQGWAKTNFVNNLYNLVVQYDLDGIDMDWEYPSASSQGLYVNLLSALRTKMNTHPTKNLELSTAVPASAYRGQHFSSSAFQYLDDIHIMAYDASPRINHSTYAFAASAIDYWQSRGVSSSRLQLGLPFYGWNSSGSSMAYKDIVAADASAPNKVYPNVNTCDQSNGYGYNAKKLIEDKVQLALNENIGGVMIWAVDQDHSNPLNSLLNVIDAKLSGGSGGGGSGGGSGGSCTPWSAGTQYYTGDIVRYNGSNYICVHDNPGYDPVISHWFWDPTSKNCDGNTGGGTCTAWSAGTQYYTGDIVSYDGNNYVCEHDNPGYNPVISTWFWEPTSAGCRSVRLDIKKASKNIAASVYPNPLSTTILNVAIKSTKGTLIDIEIIDIQGRVIKRLDLGKLNNSHTTFQLDASNLKPGSYLIYIITDQGKIVKQLSVI